MTKGLGTNEAKGTKMKMEFIDIKHAYFHADAIRDVYIEFPPEDYEQGMCGKLVKSMYGIRDAAQNWEEAYSEFTTKSGFTKGVCSPCVFYHKQRDLRVVVHGDDFTILGHTNGLDWFKEEIKKIFKIKHRG